MGMQVEGCEKNAGNAICYSAMSIQKGRIAPAIQELDFAKSNSRIEN